MDLVAKTAEADLLLMAKSDKAGNSGDKKGWVSLTLSLFVIGGLSKKRSSTMSLVS